MLSFLRANYAAGNWLPARRSVFTAETRNNVRLLSSSGLPVEPRSNSTALALIRGSKHKTHASITQEAGYVVEDCTVRMPQTACPKLQAPSEGETKKGEIHERKSTFPSHTQT